MRIVPPILKSVKVISSHVKIRLLNKHINDNKFETLRNASFDKNQHL